MLTSTRCEEAFRAETELIQIESATRNASAEENAEENERHILPFFGRLFYTCQSGNLPQRLLACDTALLHLCQAGFLLHATHETVDQSCTQQPRFGQARDFTVTTKQPVQNQLEGQLILGKTKEGKRGRKIEQLLCCPVQALTRLRRNNDTCQTRACPQWKRPGTMMRPAALAWFFVVENAFMTRPELTGLF